MWPRFLLVKFLFIPYHIIAKKASNISSTINKTVTRTGDCRFSQARTLGKEKGSRINARINRRIKVPVRESPTPQKGTLGECRKQSLLARTNGFAITCNGHKERHLSTDRCLSLVTRTGLEPMLPP